MRTASLSCIAILLCHLSCSGIPQQAPAPAAPRKPPVIAWQPYSPAVFERARAEHKFVLLDLQAVWCHWCHVMDDITYSDPQVIALIGDKYIAVKVDQDSRPDISARYEDYGWPATIVFNADGGEIVKRQGYIPPKPMARLLQAIIDDPTPGPSVQPRKAIEYSDASSLSPQLKDELERKLNENYDPKLGGWGTVHKYLDWEAIEWSIWQAQTGDHAAEHRARQTLDAALKLIDPVWGGLYQYSVDGDWDHPHFEKIMQFQAEGIRTYSLAYARWHDPAYLKAAQEIRRYLADFLTSPEGAFYTSQDADLIDGQESDGYFAQVDVMRRKRGIPRVDTHVYSRENGWAIAALVALSNANSNPQDLNDAIRAADWIAAHRALPGGGFRHDESDASGPYLADTLAMGRAFLALYGATADRRWLDRAQAAAAFIIAHFSDPSAPGFLPVESDSQGALRPVAELDQNLAACEFFNLLAYYTGSKQDRAAASNAMRFLATPQIADGQGPWVAGILLAAAQSASEPLHVTIIGSKSDPAASALFHEALRAPTDYVRLEWWDPQAGPLPNMDVEYPKLKYAAAFVCTATTCSPPIKTTTALGIKLGIKDDRK